MTPITSKLSNPTHGGYCGEIPANQTLTYRGYSVSWDEGGETRKIELRKCEESSNDFLVSFYHNNLPTAEVFLSRKATQVLKDLIEHEYIHNPIEDKIL